MGGGNLPVNFVDEEKQWRQYHDSPYPGDFENNLCEFHFVADAPFQKLR